MLHISVRSSYDCPETGCSTALCGTSTSLRKKYSYHFCGDVMSTFRYRSTGNIATPILYTETLNWTTCANRVPKTTVYTAGYYQGYKKTMSDYVTKDWYKLRGKQFVYNDMDITESTITVVGSSNLVLTWVTPVCTGPNLIGTSTSTGALFLNCCYWANLPLHGTSFPGDTLTAAVDETWIECLSNRGKGQANLLEDLAEMGKTFAMLHSPAENVITLVKSLRRSGKRLKTYRKVNANSKALIIFASSEWLRFRYGIMPLVNSIKAIRKVMERGYQKAPKIYTARAVKDLFYQEITDYHYVDSALTFNHRRATTSQAKIRASFSDSYTLGPLQDLGFTFRDLVGLPWELLRYSFVIDWFVNIGDNFYANIPRPGFVEKGGGVSLNTLQTSVWAPYGGVTATNPTVRTVSGGLGDSLIRKTRIYHRYSPTFRTKLTIRNDFKLDQFVRATDALTVAIQWLNSIGFDRH